MILFRVDLPATAAPTFRVTLPALRPVRDADLVEARILAALPGSTVEVATRVGLSESAARARLTEIRNVSRVVGEGDRRRRVWRKA